MEHLPEIFLKSGYGKCHVIIDYVEVFIERPKSLSSQVPTWSHYKNHNTFKFWVGFTPTGFILFLSSYYGGQVSDKFITRDSGFYDLLERDDEVMADRGFQSQEGLLLHFCRMFVPSDAKVKSQTTRSEVKKTNLRIHGERATNRRKSFRVLKGTIPVTMIQHVDDKKY